MMESHSFFDILFITVYDIQIICYNKIVERGDL